MLPTQVQYWANQEQRRHNLATEALTKTELSIRNKEAETKSREADIKAFESRTNRFRQEVDSVNALTAQTEAKTRQLAQETNEARRIQDYELGLLQNEIASKNAESTAIQARAGAQQSLAYAQRAGVETDLMPYSTGANIAASVGSAVSKLAGPAAKVAKSAKSGVQSLLYALRN